MMFHVRRRRDFFLCLAMLLAVPLTEAQPGLSTTTPVPGAA